MRRLIIDRYEGKYVICEDSDQKSFAIEVSELPEGAKPGCVLDITEDGTLVLNTAETEQRKKRIGEKQRKLFG